jgi:hypothetical protein
MKYAALVTGLLLAASIQAQTLVKQQTVDLGAEPKAVRIADLDGDGANEVLFFTAYAFDNSQAGTLHVVDVDSADALVIRGSLPISQIYIHDVALAIARGPGGSRLAIAGAKKKLVSVSWNGSIFASYPLTTSLENLKLEALDLDGDGIDEIVSHSWSSGGAVFGINQDLSLSLRFNLPTTAGGYNDMTTGDFNSDGLEDVAIMSGQGLGPDVQVFLSDGEGGFLPSVSYTVGPNHIVDGVAGGDVNGDGRDDLTLTARTSPVGLHVFTQDSAGTLAGPSWTSAYALPHDVIVADFENDAVNEVVVTHHSSPAVAIHRTDSSGVLPGAEFYWMSLSSMDEQMLDAGDVDDDGCLDLAVARGPSGATLLRGRTCLAPSPDTTPDAFAFPARTGVERNELVLSIPVEITGIDAPAPISVIGGQYSVNGGSETSEPGTVVSGDVVHLAQRSSAGFSTSVTTTLIVGGVSGSFTTTTLAQDTTPDFFGFAPVSNVLLGATVGSNPITVSGINDAAPISVTGGSYSVNGGVLSTSPGIVQNGDVVVLQHTAATIFATVTSTVLAIGGVSAQFTSTTEARDVTPAPFTFADVTGVATGALITSAPVTVSGVNDVTPMGVAGGSYSVNGGAFTTQAGTVRNGDQVRVQHTSASSALASVATTLTIGGVSGTFTSQTSSVDTTPAGFVFHDVLDARRGKQVTSAAVTVTEFNAPVAISITGAGASYAINSGAYTTAPGTIRSGDRVTLRLIASPAAYATVSTTLTVGGTSDTWDVKTSGK